MLWYLRTPPPPTFPVSLLGVTVSPSGVPLTGAQKGGRRLGKGLERHPHPPAQANFPPAELLCDCVVFKSGREKRLLVDAPTPPWDSAIEQFCPPGGSFLGRRVHMWL